MNSEASPLSSVRKRAFAGGWDPPARVTKPAFLEAERLAGLRAAALAEAVRKVDEIIAAAKEAVSSILAAAEADAAVVREQARAAGIAEGQETLARVVGELTAEVSRQKRAYQRDVLEDAMKFAREVLSAELDANSTHILAAAEKLLRKAGVRRRAAVALRVHREDALTLTEALDRLHAAAPDLGEVRVTVDNEAARGTAYLAIGANGSGYAADCFADLDDLGDRLRAATGVGLRAATGVATGAA